MNLLHDIDPGTKEEMNVIIEINKGSHNKYELDKVSGILKLDRANYGPTAYPIEYGFIPQTLAEDGDAADILLFATYPLLPGVLVAMRPVALMEMTDDGEPDNKIIGVPAKDQRWDDVQDLKDLNRHTLQEIKLFFETIKQLKTKPAVVTVHGFKDKAAAQAEFERARKMYADKK
ncbi:MAG: inorganic diphosphatase [bacterium]|nr:inorganic diphosphatase [bacterium]